MLRIRFSPLLNRWSLLLVLAAALLPTAWAKPKFKVIANVGGGLFQGVTFDSKGNLFGVTAAGDGDNCGTVFELTPQPKGKWALTTIHDFAGATEGCGPNGNLIFDPEGNAYGTTAAGVLGYGTVYELTPGSGGWSLNMLFAFDGTDGDGPSGLVMDAAGNLYGVAGGGMYSQGLVYELMPGQGGWNQDVLYNFGSHDRDGDGPRGLIVSGAGDLYGTTALGGSYREGSAFRLKRSGDAWQERLLYNFCPDQRFCVDGAIPYDGVVRGTSGHLYGTTEAGGSNVCGEGRCGAVFELKPTAKGRWKEAVLYNFRPGNSGNFPSSAPLFDKVGGLYGTAGVGGIGSCPFGCGVVYELTPGVKGRRKYTILHQFDGADGSMPGGGLALDDKGNLYGTAYSVVFEIVP
jgi:hypothetical protein